MPVYSQSKLACLLFALELDRRSQQISWDMRSFAAHPGISRTNLWLNASGKYSFERIMRTILPVLFQPAAQGALPALYVVTALEAKPGAYFGPDKMGQTRGHPPVARTPAAALDARLWQCSEELTGVSFPGRHRG